MLWLAPIYVTYNKSIWVLVNVIKVEINNWKHCSFTLLTKNNITLQNLAQLLSSNSCSSSSKIIQFVAGDDRAPSPFQHFPSIDINFCGTPINVRKNWNSSNALRICSIFVDKWKHAAGRFFSTQTCAFHSWVIYIILGFRTAR